MKEKLILLIVLMIAACLVDGCATASLAELRMDGQFNDWAGVPMLANDAVGDGTGAFDVTQVQATSRGTWLLLRYDVGRVLNVQNGPEDEGTLRLEIAWSEGRLTVDLRGRTAWVDGDPTDVRTWSDIGFVTSPTFADDEFETQINLAPFGLKAGREVSIQFAGSDSLPAPARFVLMGDSPRVVRRPAARLEDTAIRIASFNTLREGLVDPNRAPAFARLLRAVAADVYCFQEERQSKDLKGVITRLVPDDSKRPWRLHRQRDCVIATRLPIVPVRVPDVRSAYAVVEAAPGHRILVVSTHPAAGGWIGNQRDRWRIEEMTSIGKNIESVRAGRFEGLTVAPDLPAVVIGDYNLVGSRTPLDILTDPRGPGLVHWLLPHLAGESVTTWRDDSSGFWPGLLDLVTHSPTLSRRNGFILDSTRLDKAGLRALGLRPWDSQVSDHLLLVADFAWERSPER